MTVIFAVVIALCILCSDKETNRKKKPKWISVRDQYPKQYVPVLIHSSRGPFSYTEVAILDSNNIWHFTYDSSEALDVTHWTPLPKFYR